MTLTSLKVKMAKLENFFSSFVITLFNQNYQIINEKVTYIRLKDQNNCNNERQRYTFWNDFVRLRSCQTSIIEYEIFGEPCITANVRF